MPKAAARQDLLDSAFRPCDEGCQSTKTTSMRSMALLRIRCVSASLVHRDAAVDVRCQPGGFERQPGGFERQAGGFGRQAGGFERTHRFRAGHQQPPSHQELRTPNDHHRRRSLSSCWLSLCHVMWCLRCSGKQISCSLAAFGRPSTMRSESNRVSMLLERGLDRMMGSSVIAERRHPFNRVCGESLSPTVANNNQLGFGTGTCFQKRTAAGRRLVM